MGHVVADGNPPEVDFFLCFNLHPVTELKILETLPSYFLNRCASVGEILDHLKMPVLCGPHDWIVVSVGISAKSHKILDDV